MAKYWENLEYHEDNVEKHKITSEEIQFLKELQHEMNTQDSVGQAAPRYWVIRDYSRIYGDDLNNPDGMVVYDEDCNEVLCEMEYCIFHSESAIKCLLDNLKVLEYDLSDETIESIKSAYDFASLKSVLEYLDEVNFAVREYQEIPVDKGFFLTQKAAEKHLRANDYNYAPCAHTYGHTAWRSSEEKLWDILQKVDFEAFETKKEGRMNMSNKCAWCKIDVNTNQKFRADTLPDGRCNECGAWNDIGQQVISVNSMKQMYQGCLNLMQYVVETCGDMLKAADIDFDTIKEKLDMDKSKPLSIEVGTWQIVKMLFLIHGSSGGTSTGNMTHLLGLKKEGVSFFFEDIEQE